MFNRTTLRKFIAPRRQARKVRHCLFLRTLAGFAPWRESQFSMSLILHVGRKFKYLWLGLRGLFSFLRIPFCHFGKEAFLFQLLKKARVDELLWFCALC